MREQLRVIDFGEVSPLRSQTLWHAVVRGVDQGQPPTLSFLRTAAPYVSIGLHRSTEELDREVCRQRGWPIFRRRAGGGAVYMDRHQLCFQITVPAKALPASRPKATRLLLEPAVEAFRAAGLSATLDPRSEIVAGDRKVCGHGAAQIGSAVVMVGNLIERFDHAAASSVLKAPDLRESEETCRLMRRYVAFDGEPPPLDARAFVRAACCAYSRTLGLSPRDGQLAGIELDELVRLDRQFCDPAWVEGGQTPRSGVWKVKIKGGVWQYFREGKGRCLALSVVDRRVVRARAEGYGCDSSLVEILEGSDLVDTASRALRVGEPGRQAAIELKQLVMAAAPDWA